MKGSDAKGTRIGGSRCRAIAWIVLLAFTVQSFVTQTHIHGAFETGAAAAVAGVHKKAPSTDGKADCPFCQAIVHAGAFHTPPAQILALPLFWSTVATSFLVAQTFVSVSSHLWQSRAPPRH